MARKIIVIGLEKIRIDENKAEEVSAELGEDIDLVERAYGILRYNLDGLNEINKSGYIHYSWESLKRMLKAAMEKGYYLEDVVDIMENSMGDSDFVSVESFLKALDMESSLEDSYFMPADSLLDSLEMNA